MTPQFRRAGLPLALMAIAAVALTQWPVLFLGFHQDSFVTVHPWTMAELRHAFTGTWLTGFPLPLHRPIAIVILAAEFEVFGLNSFALHVISLCGLAWIVWLASAFLRDEAGPRAAFAGIAVYLTHPVLLESTSALEQSHFQLFCLLMVVLALRSWQKHRGESFAAWWPIFAWSVLAFYTKEESVLILPLIAALQWLRARTIGDVRPPSAGLVSAVTLLAIVLAAIRWALLPGTPIAAGAFGLESLRIAAYAPLRTALVMALDGNVLPIATAFFVLINIAGLWRVVSRPASPAGWLWIVGAVLFVGFSVPLAFVDAVRATRLHMAVFGASILCGAGLFALFEWRPQSKLAAAICAVIAAVGLTAQFSDQRQTIEHRFEPCSVDNLWQDRVIFAEQPSRHGGNGWCDHFHRDDPSRSPDIRAWMIAKPARCENGTYRSLEDDLDFVRWLSPSRASIWVNASAASVELRFATLPTSAVLNVAVDGGGIDGTALRVTTIAGPPTFTVALTSSWRSWLQRGHRIDVTGTTGFDTPPDVIVSRR